MPASGPNGCVTPGTVPPGTALGGCVTPGTVPPGTPGWGGCVLETSGLAGPASRWQLLRTRAASFGGGSSSMACSACVGCKSSVGSCWPACVALRSPNGSLNGSLDRLRRPHARIDPRDVPTGSRGRRLQRGRRRMNRHRRQRIRANSHAHVLRLPPQRRIGSCLGDRPGVGSGNEGLRLLGLGDCGEEQQAEAVRLENANRRGRSNGY